MNLCSLLNDAATRNYIKHYDNSLLEIDKRIRNAAKQNSINEETVKEINTWLDLINKATVSDDLCTKLSEQKSSVYYYVGINKFILDYYKENPSSEWKIKAVLQLGFPFGFADLKLQSEPYICNSIIKKYLENKKWSLFIFSKEPIKNVTIGFDDRDTFSRLSTINEDKQSDIEAALKDLPENYNGNPILAWGIYNNDLYDMIDQYLSDDKIPVLTNAQYEKLEYSFTEIPGEYFRIDYLDYLSRYKKSVVDVFGYPEKDEKIKKLKSIVEFVNAPGKDHVWPGFAERKNHVLIKNFFFQNRILKPTVRVGEQNVDLPFFFEEYEIHSFMKTISPYYLYCLLSSELVTDFYSENYEDEKYYDANTPLPLEDCIFIEMSCSKMCDKKFEEKYERDIRPTLKAQEMILSKDFNNTNAKDSIEKYLVEIKNDIDSGSYYSATIVMGSVLEAFLIDWLSELDGKNYFEEDYLVPDKRHNYQRRADLMDYIDIIQKRRPDWIEGARKATEIRRKRNLVHAKLYIEEGEITQEICYEMLRNLEIIINNRWPKK